jgi:GNAT superfamily N-acetyltransferase
MVLEGELNAAPRTVAIREVVGDEDWGVYRELQELEHEEYRQRLGRPPSPPTDEFLQYVRAKSPPARAWLAYEDGQPHAYCSSWSGNNGVGMVEDLFTHSDFRRRGLATALIAHCVADARANGAGPVLITADPTDWPMQTYARMNFRPLFVHRSQYR